MNPIVERIERQAGVTGLTTILAERLSPTDLQSLLIEVYARRSARRQPADVLADYASDRFVHPSSVSPRRLIEWEQVAFANLPFVFQPLALAPVCPLGTSAVLSGVDQDWAVATSRNTEVVSDSTNVLALECAIRRRERLRVNPKSIETVHLAASHRLLRAQHYRQPSLTSHFSALALCSAGRDQGNLSFELDALKLHIRFYLNALQAFLGQAVPLFVAATDFSDANYEALEAGLLAPLRAEFPSVECAMDEKRTGGRGYYANLCFHIYAADASGQRRELTDGGAVDWTQRLLSNRKERLIISGVGSERVCAGEWAIR